MKIALVHDYLNEFGGAERVLEALANMYPQAPIYTAFFQPDSPAHRRFKNKHLITSWAQRVPGFKQKLHSPLRFLAPMIWESFNFDEFDLVISSASWYITKGIITQPETLHLCYCHTPPRYLYGYDTAMDWKKSWLIRQYAHLVNPMMRQYDYLAAQRVDYFLTNSQTTQERIKKFYRRESEVVYPPVDLSLANNSDQLKKENFLLTGGRLVGAKNFELVIQAANKLRQPLKVFGDGPLRAELESIAGGTVEFVGRVSESELAKLYQQAKAFVALATDEDFGITPVESMMAGTPVIAFRGGGYTESVVEGKSGVFINQLSVDQVIEGVRAIDNRTWKAKQIKKLASKFSTAEFEQTIKRIVTEQYNKLTKFESDYA